MVKKASLSDAPSHGGSVSVSSIKSSVPAIRLLAAEEIRVNLYNWKIPVALVALVALFQLSSYLLLMDYGQRVESSTANREAQHSASVGGVVKYESQGGTFFHRVGSGPEPPVQQPHPFSVLVKGIDSEVDRTVTLGQRIGFGPRQHEIVASAFLDTPDTLFVVKFILSLFALIFSLDMITREKESGRLRAILAMPLRRRDLLWGKAIGAFLSLAAPFGLAYLTLLVHLHIRLGLLANNDAVGRALLIFLLSLLYCLVFTLLGLYISTTALRTKTAVVAAVFAWGTAVVLLPNASALGARILSPAPTYNQLTAHLFESYQQIMREEAQSAPTDRPPADRRDTKRAWERLSERDRQLTDDYFDRLWGQISHARTWSIVSPAGSLAFASSDLAGTGAFDYLLYLNYLRAGRDTITDAMGRRWDLPRVEGDKLWRDTLEQVASRERQSQSLGGSLRSASWMIASLAGWAVLLAIMAGRRFERYDVR
jgi:ABC-type transport system involved in multi-copper enzyme maturation permease subunit